MPVSAVNTIAIAVESVDQSAWIALAGAPQIRDFSPVLLNLTTVDAIADLLMTAPSTPQHGRFIAGDVRNDVQCVPFRWNTWLDLCAGMGVETAYRWTIGIGRWQVTRRIYQSWIGWGDLAPLAYRLNSYIWLDKE